MTVAKRAAAEVALSAGNRLMTPVAVGLLAFASVFLMIAWQFGPLVWVETQQYKKMTSHVDGRIVESWIALEFDAKDVRNPEFWRDPGNQRHQRHPLEPNVEGEYIFLPAAKEAVADTAASAATHKSAKRFVDEWGHAAD